LILTANTDLHLATVYGDIILDSGGNIDMSLTDAMILPQRTSAPSSPPDGLTIFNPNTGYTNVYSAHDGDWHHFNRDSGWA
jgi:hypothetical protein